MEWFRAFYIIVRIILSMIFDSNFDKFIFYNLAVCDILIKVYFTKRMSL